MNGARQIAVDFEQGEVRLGLERVRLLPVAGDVFYLNDARGPLVRALRFEERSRLLADVADEDVASRIAGAALVSSGDGPDEVRVAASLALAGGGEHAPSFPECVRFVEQQPGWDAQRVGKTMALVIDRLCGDVVQQDSNGWKQIVFENHEAGADLVTLISQMVTNLSQRAVTSALKNNVEPETADKRTTQWSSSQSFQSLSANEYEAQKASKHGSMQSVSSGLPVARVPARVLGLNTHRRTHNDSIVRKASVISDTPSPEAPAGRQAAPMSSTIPTTPQTTDFPTTLKPQTNHVNFSLSRAAASARIEPSTVVPPVATFPSWQPFSNIQSSSESSSGSSSESSSASSSGSSSGSSSERGRTSSRAFSTPVESPSTNDLLSELALLLEAECDMRGIDP